MTTQYEQIPWEAHLKNRNPHSQMDRITRQQSLLMVDYLVLREGKTRDEAHRIVDGMAKYVETNR